MFSLRNKSSAEAGGAPLGALDRIGRRSAGDAATDAPPPPTAANDRNSRLTAAAATLGETVAPKLRTMVAAGTSAGDITRQAGLLAQVHFRSHGVMLAPLELRGFVAEVLRPVLPATTFRVQENAQPTDEAPSPLAPADAEAAMSNDKPSPPPSLPREANPFASAASNNRPNEPAGRS